MQVKSIVECSKGSILQYFPTSLSYHLSLRSLFCLFSSDLYTQVLLYIIGHVYMSRKVEIFISIQHIKFISKKSLINPFKPSVLIMVHRQTMQNQIRRRRARRLISFLTVCLQNVCFVCGFTSKSTAMIQSRWSS